MTKAEIVQGGLLPAWGVLEEGIADPVDLVFETMKETLGRGEKIKISGFGNFVLRDKRQRQGRNPQTGDPILITGAPGPELQGEPDLEAGPQPA